jgi:small subunit ribosomal protein S7
MRRAFKKHTINPDRLYQDVQVQQLINKVMKQGKKTTAQAIVYGAFEDIKNKTKKEPLEIFKKALENAMPMLEVKPKRIGGATYQVPMEVRQERKVFLALKWIIDGARSAEKENQCKKV